jgi:phytoene desaturase
MEFADARLLGALLKMDVFQSFHKHIRRFFKHPQILQLMEFPILFLGALPKNTPALYSLMNYADIKLGTWYPQGGMHKIVEGMVKLAEKFGVTFRYNQEVTKIKVQGNKAIGVLTRTDNLNADVVIAGADYHHVETQLLDEPLRSYSPHYWDKRVLAPSCLLYYVGVSKKLKNLLHHNLFFDTDFMRHAEEIYTKPQYPTEPLFYVSAPSITDASVAPEGCENLFMLIPVAPDLPDTPETREKYFDMILTRLEQRTGQTIRESIVYKRTYAHQDFKADYHAFKGNAYGLANTLMQTAILKPSLKSKKIKNLYYTGQLTVPGPGVPPSLISGQVVADEVIKDIKKT